VDGQHKQIFQKYLKLVTTPALLIGCSKTSDETSPSKGMIVLS